LASNDRQRVEAHDDVQWQVPDGADPLITQRQ
jgi:hypothetical protein